MGYFDWLDPGLGRERTAALSQALLGLGAGMLGQGPTSSPQTFASSLARGGAGFASGLQQGLENARRARLLGLEDQRQGSLAAFDVIAPIIAKIARGHAITAGEQKALDTYKSMNPMQQMIRDAMAGGQRTEDAGQAAPAVATPPATAAAPLGSSKEAPQPITSEYSADIVRGIWASGKPMWLKGPDGTVDQVTPEQAKAWLLQHGLLK